MHLQCRKSFPSNILGLQATANNGETRPWGERKTFFENRQRHWETPLDQNRVVARRWYIKDTPELTQQMHVGMLDAVPCFAA